MKLLAAFALGSLVAYTVAVVALTDWLEIDWNFRQ